jgi:SulP family sulfate permease
VTTPYLAGCGVLPLLGPSTKMQPLFNGFMEQPYEVKRDCVICWATLFFTFTATPTLDIGLYKAGGLHTAAACG